MKKIKNEAALVKKALSVGNIYAQKRGYTSFTNTMSAKEKVECIYRLLVHDKLITPLPKEHEDNLNMKYKLALWISRQLPKDDPLLR